MEKPTLRMALHQVVPPLPDSCEFAARISASLRFIDENPAAVASDLTPEMLELWAISQHELDVLRDCFERVAEIVMVAGAANAGEASRADFGPRVLSSLIIFAHIYLTYYRLEDFADLENFADTYIKFQQLLQRANRNTGYHFQLFDLENLDQTLDDSRGKSKKL